MIVTDTQKIGLGAASATAEREAYLDSLDALAADPSVDGVVVDVVETPRVVALRQQVAEHSHAVRTP